MAKRRRSQKERDERYLTHCRDRIESARKYRDGEGLDALWERLIDLYAGRHFPKDLSADDRIAVNIAFATINVIAPSVSINSPKIVVDAKQPEDEDRAVVAEAVVNYWWKHYEVHEEFRRAVDDFLMIGFGWLKTGYRFVEEEVDDPDGFEEELSAALEDVETFRAENPDAEGLPSEDEIAANIPTTRLQVVEDRPFVERVSWADVYVDPEATSLRDARWIAQRTVRSLYDVQTDEHYDERARTHVQADGRVEDRIRPETVADRDPNWQHVTVWEFYDLKAGTMSVFADAGEGFLVEPKEQPYAFGHPFVMLRNYDIPDRFYPMGELEAIECLQHELNATRTAMLNDRKQKRRAWLYNPQAFDKKGRAELASAKDNRMIPVAGNVPLGEAVVPMPSQQLDPQMYQNSEIIENDIAMITAQSEYARGSLPEIRRTATEASIIQDAANARAADKLAKVERVIGQVARRLVQLAQQYMTEAEVVRVTGQNGRPVWVEMEPDDIQGEFDFDVEGGSTQPINEQGRRQQAQNLLQTLAPLMVPGGPVNTPEVLKYVLKSYGIKDAERFVQVEQQLPGIQGAPPEEEGADLSAIPSAAPLGLEGGAPQGPPAEGTPPELLAQLEGQVGLSL